MPLSFTPTVVGSVTTPIPTKNVMIAPINPLTCSICSDKSTPNAYVICLINSKIAPTIAVSVALFFSLNIKFIVYLHNKKPTQCADLFKEDVGYHRDKRD